MQINAQTIAEEIATANGTTVRKLGLRFDRVVQRLLKGLDDSLTPINPNGKTVIVTITAPIVLPGKTEGELPAAPH